MSMPSSRLRRRDEGGEPAGLQLLLDLEALLAGDAAVVGADELLAGELVEALREPLREAAAVGEDDRAAVLADQLAGSAGGSPARCSSAARRRATGPPGCSSIGRTSPSLAMSSTGTTTWSSSGLRAPASTMLTSRPVADAAEVPGDGLERPLGGAEADALDRGGRVRVGAPPSRLSRRSRLRARCAPRLVPAIAWTSSTITCSTPRRISRAWLVSRRYRLSGVVTRMSGGWRTRSRRSSAGVSPVRDATRMLGRLGSPSRCGREGDAGERGAEVALDVVGQRLERADVQDADGAGLLACRRRARVARRAGPGTTGTRRGSCRCRSGRGSACGGRRRWPPSPRTGPASGPRTSPRTRP